MNERQSPDYEFDGFRIDTGRRLLLRADGQPVALTPKAFATLLHLVEHTGQLLEKEALMAAVWPDTIVEQNNLTQSVSALRRVLGERPDAHQYIVTVPGRGYRFVADVTAQVRSSGPVQAESHQSAPRLTIAVMPFANISADPENEYFCDGLAEELTNALTRLEQIRVVARTSAYAFKGTGADVREIGRKLNVATVLEGSVRKSASRLRITVQLINVADGYHLWSESYDRMMQDIFDVQEEITLAVVSALKVRLFGAEKAAVLKRHTANTEAYHLYLKGRYYWYKAAPGDLIKSREFFQRAIDLDPTYALGYCGLADYYGFAAAVGLLPPGDGWPKAEAAAIKARDLDEALAEVHNPLAAQQMMYHRNWAGAEREFRRGIELNPQFAEIHILHSYYLVAMGRFDEAIAESRLALQIDPLSLRYSRYVGNWLYYARRYDEAIAQYRQALELAPDNAPLHEDLGDAFERLERYDEAIAAWQRAMILAGEADLAATLERAYAEGGFAGGVRAMTRQRLDLLNRRIARGDYVPTIEFARAYVRLGDAERAFEWLRKASAERNVSPLMVNSDPFYDSLRPDPRFAAFVRSLELTS